MNSVITLGPLAVPSDVVLGFFAVLTGFAGVSVYCYVTREKRSYYFDKLLTALVIFLLAWKIGPALTDVRSLSAQPRLLLYAPARPIHLVIALALFFLYGLRVYLKEKRDKKVLFIFFLFIAVSASVFAAGRYLLPVMKSEPERREGEAALPVPGQKAPNFSAETLEGEAIELSDFLGTPVILNFWASWCPPCKAEIPELRRFYREQGEAAVIIAINSTATERDVTAVKAYVLKEELEFPVLLDFTGSINRLYGVTSIPTTFIIDAEGKVTKIHTGAVTGRWLESVLGLH